MAAASSEEVVVVASGTTPSASQDSLVSSTTDHASQSTMPTESSTPSSPKPRDRRFDTPERQPATDHLRTPVSVTSPSKGLKRFANGTMKSNDNSPQTRLRAESVGSTGSIAGELKTRLTYAMTKVQHGWEHHNIEQVEQLAAAKLASPSRHLRRPSHQRSSTSPRSITDSQSLASATRLSPPLTRPASRAVAPVTPKVRRCSSIRDLVQTAQDEQDAMDALLLMGSPGRKDVPCQALQYHRDIRSGIGQHPPDRDRGPARGVVVKADA